MRKLVVVVVGAAFAYALAAVTNYTALAQGDSAPNTYVKLQPTTGTPQPGNIFVNQSVSADHFEGATALLIDSRATGQVLNIANINQGTSAATGIFCEVYGNQSSHNTAIWAMNHSGSSMTSAILGQQESGGTGVAGTSWSGIGVSGSSTQGTGVVGVGDFCGGEFTANSTGNSYGVIASGRIGLRATSSDGSGAPAIYCDGNMQVAGNAITPAIQLTTSPGAGRVLVSDATGHGTWQDVPGLSLPYTGSANVGSGSVFSVTNTATTGTNSGIYGQANSATGRGVNGFSASGYGVYGESTTNIGVYGIATATTGTSFGVYGQNNSTSGRGVYGQASGASGTIYGVRGFASTGTAGYAVYAAGDFGASGTKAFVIDHPFDPENKYLKHYCSEGPEPLNVYTGNVVTDASGVAWVELPDYFAEINKDFRYTLTVVDDTDSAEFVQAKIAREIRNNRFKIRTSAPRVKVSWRIDAVRNDLWLRAHGAPVEVTKDEFERGKYQHPELYGQPKELAIDYSPAVKNTPRK